MKNAFALYQTTVLIVGLLLALACSNRTAGEKAAALAAATSDSALVLPEPPPPPANAANTPPELPPPVHPEQTPDRPRVPTPKPTTSTEAVATAPPAAKPDPVPVSATSPAVWAAPSHEPWNALLGQYVNASGQVNYVGLKANRIAFNAYLDSLAAHPPRDNWSRAEKMAYWINVYNAFTVDLILDHYPLSSIQKLDGGKTWDVKRITLGGRKYSLNQLENDILRPQFKDPRIHFALNCAAKSCPPLQNKAFTAERLEAMLDAGARAFINNAQYNTLDAKSVKVSKIFDWYAADFGQLPPFLNRYADQKVNADAAVTFQEYDWALNGL